MGMTLGLALVGVLQAAPDLATLKAMQDLGRARVEAARQTYQAVWKNNREAVLPLAELPYRWSKRWLEAELDLSDQKANQVAAYLAHLNRMKDVERITKERFRARVNPIEEATSAEFYRLEAELWWMKARNR